MYNNTCNADSKRLDCDLGYIDNFDLEFVGNYRIFFNQLSILDLFDYNNFQIYKILYHKP